MYYLHRREVSGECNVFLTRRFFRIERVCLDIRLVILYVFGFPGKG